MKIISIFRKGSDVVKILDDDKTPLSEYSEKLSQVFEVTNVVILETSNGNIILRPSKIDFIHVEEEVIIPQEEINIETEKIKVKEKAEDVVTEEKIEA